MYGEEFAELFLLRKRDYQAYTTMDFQVTQRLAALIGGYREYSDDIALGLGKVRYDVEDSVEEMLTKLESKWKAITGATGNE